MKTTHICDFVLCRKDGPYSDNRRPDHVEPGTLMDDLARRDFTVNAMALDKDGKMIDPFGGQADIVSKTLRCVRSNPTECFSEDPIRLLRAMRFVITKGFNLDPSIVQCFQDPSLMTALQEKVHNNRKRAELNKCFCHDTVNTVAFLASYPLLNVACFGGTGLWIETTCKKMK
jgi:tRNA nucleotidyltransferase (CCA-adding enzyme)